MVIILLFLSMGILFLVSRISYIKLTKGTEYEKKAKEQRNHYDISVPPTRGMIKDRNDHPLVVSKRVYNIILDPGVLNQVSENVITSTVNSLNKEFGIEKQEIYDYLSERSEDHYIPLLKKVEAEKVEGLKQLIGDSTVKGVWLEEDTQRDYLYDGLAAHIIGFIGDDGGHWGIEESYDDWLTGIPGRRLMIYNEDFYGVQEYIQPQNGNNLILTLDETIQHYMEEALKKAYIDHKAKSAVAIVMDPNTGEILGFASFPSFNSNNPMEIIPPPDEDSSYATMSYEEKVEYLQTVWRNYGISNTYEPGSTFKPLLVSAALEEGVITPEDTFDCQGSVQVADRIIHCWKRSGHGIQNVEQAVANSCNIAMINIANKMGRDLFYRYQRIFGFGDLTHVDLIGEENALSLLHKKEGLNPVELATSSFGQTFNVTPIQMINAFDAVINGGNLFKPYVVKQIVNEKGVLLKENKPVIIRQVLSHETSEELKKYLKTVVEEGTGQNTYLEGYKIGGKTGTSQKLPREEEKYILSFIGFAPVEEPKISLLVLLDEPYDADEGSGIAVNVAKDIFQEVLPYIGVYPTTEEVNNDKGGNLH